jgi:hypothetical protein
MPPSLDALAADCADRLPSTARSFADDAATLEPALGALLTAVRSHHERFAFDRDGRPAAIAAIRHALPAMEGDLLDAVLEDVACELAAYQEALYQIAVAARQKTQGA